MSLKRFRKIIAPEGDPWGIPRELFFDVLLPLQTYCCRFLIRVGRIGNIWTFSQLFQAKNDQMLFSDRMYL